MRQSSKSNNLLRNLKRNGFSESHGFAKIGFAVENLYAAQIPYLCTFQSNKWLRNNDGVDISIFFEENSPPAIQPEFARFHIKDTVAFTGSLISTSFRTALSTKLATRAKRYYYINDMEWMRQPFPYEKQDFTEIMFNDSIIKFTRSADYRDFMVKQGLKIHDNIVENFNIDQILEIINGDRS